MMKSSHDAGIVPSEGGQRSSDARSVENRESVLSLWLRPIVYKVEDRAIEETGEVGHATVGSKGVVFRCGVSVRARSSTPDALPSLQRFSDPPSK